MMTDELRWLLDKHGIRHIDDDGDVLRVTTWDGNHGRAAFKEWRTGTTRFEARGVDATTAVSASLLGVRAHD